jgi:hypothetical protein
MSFGTGVDSSAEGHVFIIQTDILSVEIEDIGPDAGKGVEVGKQLQQLIIVKENVHGLPPAWSPVPVENCVGFCDIIL